MTFDAENPIVGSLLKELDVGKKDVADKLIKKAPPPPGTDFAIQNTLDKLRNRSEPKDNNYNNFSPPPSPPPPLFPPPPSPTSFFQGSSSSNIPPPPPFVPPPSCKLLPAFEQQ